MSIYLGTTQFGTTQLADNTFFSPFEEHSNFGKNYLAVAATSTDSALIVLATSGYPTIVPFRIVVDQEIMEVTAVQGNALYVIRGMEGTSAAAHSQGAAVVHGFTSGVNDAINSTTHNEGSYFNIPTEFGAGRLYLTSDAFAFYEDSGSGYTPWGIIYPLTIPNLGSFSWLNQGTATVTSSGGGIFLATGTATNGIDMKAQIKSVPSTPYSAIFGFVWTGWTGNNNCGVFVYDSGSTKVCRAGFYTAGTHNNLFLAHHNSYNGATFDNPVNTTCSYAPNQISFFKIKDDGSNRTYYISPDGVNFTQFYTETHTNFITPTNIGFWVETQGTSTPSQATMTLLSYQETSP